jgi:glutamine synthetase adenylyltransferase
VDICGAHHTLIHDASLKAREDVRDAMMVNETEEAKAVLRELIHIIRKSRVASKKMARPMVFQHTFDPQRAANIRELKSLLGVSSLKGVIEKCVDLVYDQCTPLKKR